MSVDGNNDDKAAIVSAARDGVIDILGSDLEAGDKARALRDLIHGYQKNHIHRSLENLTVFANCNGELAHERDSKKGPDGKKFRIFTVASVIKLLEKGDTLTFQNLQSSYFPTAFVPKGGEQFAHEPRP